MMRTEVATQKAMLMRVMMSSRRFLKKTPSSTKAGIAVSVDSSIAVSTPSCTVAITPGKETRSTASPDEAG